MSRQKGDIAEDKAVEYLLKNSFLILTRNFYTRFGEIDIIAQKDGVLHFVEVKSAPDFESAVNNITPKKLLRIIRSAEVYLKKYPTTKDYTIDAIVVTPNGLEMIESITL
jgi:putative endonuclease